MKYLDRYDYIIAGGGAAGLSLLYHILNSPLSKHSILVIDREKKVQNDRTWCFWEAGMNPFEEIVHRHWETVSFHSPTFSSPLKLPPYAYKMIRGIDFYNKVHQIASTFDNIHFLYEDINSVQDLEDGAKIHTGGKEYFAKWVFSSLRSSPTEEQQMAKNHQYLLQHFKGWVIHTPDPIFDPKQATLMDFRVNQNGDCRFVYVLPTDKNTALVEYTLFSEKLLEEEAYDLALMGYLRDFFQLNDYTIEHEEFGIIPMTDMAYPPAEGAHIINIGTAGGVTKPSTGYTFLRIQEDSQQIVEKLLAGQSPHRKVSTWHERFMLYDSTLLHVMSGGLLPGWNIFSHLFKNNPPQRIFKFLDEKTSFWEEIKIANSVPKIPFIRGLWRALQR